MKKIVFLLLLCFILNLVKSTITANEPTKIYSNTQEVFIETNGVKLFCRVMGQGTPVIVIHGGAGLSQDYLLPQMAKLKEHNRVIFYDQRYCGRSTGIIDEQMVTIETFINDIEAIRKAFGYEKVSILGHSWGGFLAMNYAISHSECVEKLILLNTSPASSEEWVRFFQEYDHRIKPYEEQLKAIEKTKEFKDSDPKIMEAYYRMMFKVYFYDPQKEKDINLAMSKQAFANGTKVLEIFAKRLFSQPFNLHDKLKKINLETLIIHGDYDIVPFVIAQKIHEDISNSKYLLLKNCGHFSYIEDAEVVFYHLDNFLHPKS